jgi:heptosyltransferase-1
VKLLLIKTSSLGDVVHTLPAVTEALGNVPDLEIDWVVEEGFADIPAIHPGVANVIPVAIRRWRQNWWQARGEIREFVTRLRSQDYDIVLDSQGLMKSALIAACARGQAHGYNRASARESAAALFYHGRHAIAGDQHAIYRQKSLMGSALGYVMERQVDYGIRCPTAEETKTILLLHGTTWRSKEWPESCWRDLAQQAARAGYELLVPAGNGSELAKAGRILDGLRGRILDRLPLKDLIEEMQRCSGVVSVDTGLGHLSPALGIPVVAMFGATSPSLTGVMGPFSDIIVSNHLPCIPCKRRDCEYPIPGDSVSIYPPCFDRTTPETVWQALQQQIGSKATKPG